MPREVSNQDSLTGMSDNNKPTASTAAGPNAVPARSDAAGSAAATINDAAKKAGSEQNPALKMMGIPRFRLPSRNWMIFLGVTGSIAAAITYDRWQTRKIKEKWCKMVSHIKDEPLSTTSLPRTVTIYLSAPPGDGLRSAREHFHDYVKPVLVAAALDWDVVEGRKEGDVRYKTAERIRRRRRIDGEGTPLPPEDYTVAGVRKNMGVHNFEGTAGDIVVGRHTWKEYIRGLHEGWLGPVDAPAHVDIAMGTVPEPNAVPATEKVAATPVVETLKTTVDAVAEAAADANKQEDVNIEEKLKEADKAEGETTEEKPKPRQPPPYIDPTSYAAAVASQRLPDALEPSAPVSCPHILGFRNTPIRLYRYFTRRRLADEIGRQVAAAVLGSNRAFAAVSVANNDSPSEDSSHLQPEQVQVLEHEERDWWKTVREPRKEHEESVLIEPIYFDDRITSRMRKFELTSEQEQRAHAIAAGHDSAMPADRLA